MTIFANFILHLCLSKFFTLYFSLQYTHSHIVFVKNSIHLQFHFLNLLSSKNISTHSLFLVYICVLETNSYNKSLFCFYLYLQVYIVFKFKWAFQFEILYPITHKILFCIAK